MLCESCNERTILHCLESYLYYVILVNKKIFSEEWNEGEKKIDNIYIHCRKYKIYIDEFWRVFLTYFAASGNELYIFRQCTYIVSNRPKETVKLSKKSRNKRCSYRFWLCPLWSPRLSFYKQKSCYCFLPSLNMNQVPEKNILVRNQIQMYNKKNIRWIQCDYSNRTSAG